MPRTISLWHHCVLELYSSSRSTKSEPAPELSLSTLRFASSSPLETLLDRRSFCTGATSGAATSAAGVVAAEEEELYVVDWIGARTRNWKPELRSGDAIVNDVADEANLVVRRLTSWK